MTLTSGERVEEVVKFKDLKVVINPKGSMEEEVRMEISRKLKMASYEKVVIPTTVYGFKTWSLSVRKTLRCSRWCLRNICGTRSA